MKTSGNSIHQSTRTRKLLLVSVLIAACIVVVFQFFRPSSTSDSSFLLADARRAMSQGDFHKAGAALDRLLSIHPEHAQALLERSKLWILIGDRESAIADLREIGRLTGPIRMDEVLSEARYLQGTLQLELGRAQDAEKCFLEAWKLSMENLQPLEHVLRLYTLQMRRVEILKVLDQIEKRRPLILEEMVLRIDAGAPIIDEIDAIANLRQFVASDHEDEWSLIALLRYYVDGDRSEEASNLLLSLNPSLSNRSHFVGLKAIHQLQDSLSAEALQTMNIMLTDSPPSFWWWLAAGKLAESDQQHRLAADCYQQAVDLQPASGYAHYRLGISLEASEEWTLAQQQLELTANIDRLHQLTGVITRMIGMSNQELAAAMFRIAALCQKVNLGAETLRWRNGALQLDPQNDFDDKIASMQSSSHVAIRRHRAKSPAEAQNDILQWLAVKTNSSTLPHQTKVATIPNSRLQMEDVHEDVGLDFQYFNGSSGNKYLIEAMGGGISILDFDCDGWPDCYFPQGSKLPNDPNDFSHTDQLYRNSNGERFINVTQNTGIVENGYSQGAAAGDINNDGFPDIVVANFGRNRLFINQGDGTFLDETDRWGLNEVEMSTSVALADLDNDGNLDLYVTNYVDGMRICRDTHGNISTCSPQNFSGVQDRLYRNSGDGKFVDETNESGIVSNDGKGLGVVITDFDDDGLVDIFVANDTTPNNMFKNLGGLRFKEMGLESGTALSPDGHAQAGMGIAAADLNGDLMTDLFVTNFYFESNNLYLNQGSMCFVDSASSAGLSRPSKLMLGFGTQAEDLDLDGSIDLIVANGHIDDFTSRGEPWKMQTQLFHNQGSGVFEDRSPTSGSYFSGKVLGRGIASLDWNRDGKKDFIVVHQDRAVALLENRTESPYQSLVVRLIGRTTNRNAIGARVILESGGIRTRRDITGGDGFYSTNEKTLCFGLRTESRGEVLIHWPSGSTQKVVFHGEKDLIAIEPSN